VIGVFVTFIVFTLASVALMSITLTVAVTAVAPFDIALSTADPGIVMLAWKPVIGTSANGMLTDVAVLPVTATGKVCLPKKADLQL